MSDSRKFRTLPVDEVAFLDGVPDTEFRDTLRQADAR
jgi:hypothetical protein